MKKPLAAAILGFVLIAAACGPKAEAPPEPPKAKFGAWGYDPAFGDPSVKPGDDFWAYALGGWLKTAQIPADRTFTGIDLQLIQTAETQVKDLIAEAAATNPAAGTNAQKIGDFYAAFMDEATIEKGGVEPIRRDLEIIDNAKDIAALAPAFATLLRAGATTPFNFYIDINPKDPTRYLAVYDQGGLSFGERDYYLKTTPDIVKLRAEFVAHVERMLKLGGYADAAAQAKAILALETKMARAHWTPERARERDLTTNIRTRAQMQAMAPGEPFAGVLAGAGLDKQDEFMVSEPDVLQKTGALIASEPLDAWKAYLRYQTLVNYAAFLPKAIDDESFSFYGKALRGAQAQKERWRRAVDIINGAMGEAVGEVYVSKHFPASSKQSVQELVENLRTAFKAKIEAAKWMSEPTRKEALLKLSTFLPKLGYPDKWKNYDTVIVTRTHLIGDVKSAEEWAWKDQTRHLGGPIERDEWLMTPQTVNAYYRPETNEITFPAAILQPPYFDPGADAAVNYGAIGAVIGHELSHGFDDQGRKSDSTGKLRDWWSKEDVARYTKETEKVVAQYNAFEPLKGLHINGRHTQGENIADLAGLSIAYDAYKLSLGGKDAPVIGGVTGDQRFFLAYAQSWQTLYRPERLRDIVLTDEHSPPEFRVNGVVRNFEPWYAAFGVKEGDKLYIAPDKRAQLW